VPSQGSFGEKMGVRLAEILGKVRKGTKKRSREDFLKDERLLFNFLDYFQMVYFLKIHIC
jgi:hypothetical protein